MSATEGRDLDHDPGVLTLPPESVGLDRRAGRSVITETFDPDLVEGGTVPLQIAHHDSDPDDIGQLGARRRQDRDQVVEDLLGLGGDILRDRMIDRMRRRTARKRRSSRRPSTACGTGPVCGGASSVWMTSTKASSRSTTFVITDAGIARSVSCPPVGWSNRTPCRTTTLQRSLRRPVRFHRPPGDNEFPAGPELLQMTLQHVLHPCQRSGFAAWPASPARPASATPSRCRRRTPTDRPGPADRVGVPSSPCDRGGTTTACRTARTRRW